jgi:sarcosine oxidase subunit alpha
MAIAEAVRGRGIDIKYGHTVYEAMTDKAGRHVCAVDVRQITARGQVGANSTLIHCDLLCMSAGYMPAYQLLCQAGGKLSYDDKTAEFNLSGLPEHLHIAGSVNAVHQLDMVLADGERAAMDALSNLGLSRQQPPVIYDTSKPNYDWPIFKHPKGRDFVDYDEDLQVKDIINATRLGYRDVQLVKRFSTVGMGPSQGRHSALPTARLVANATGRTVTETGVTTARPPYAPEKLAHLAGRISSPSRRTAMHHRHLELGAQMVNIGSWQRPAYYGDTDEKESCALAETRHVRSKVGIIDVSTLGGIELRGRDAVEFINRLYTSDYSQQTTGEIRYALMLNEQGVVSDDGLVCRLSDDCFYLTTSTGGVDRVVREMGKWNAQWRLDVDVGNVTSAYAAVNVAGPAARKVLDSLVDGMDLSSVALPFMHCRQGLVAGIPARILRVGFTGELAYEIHVPALYGEALWDRLMEAGATYDLRPFGMAAQRLLRLEKGHLIVGHDTDGMSHPGELSLQWALANDKPFFIGARSASIMMQQKPVRKLVGFRLPKDSSKPEEGHLVLNGGDISGHVTSCAYSPTLDAIIGLAYVGPDQAAHGSDIAIRVDGGDTVDASVVDRCFFDSDNLRQEL